MITEREVLFIATCVEGFFYGLYSGIFAIYVTQCPSKASRTATIVFYAICLLYVLSTVLFVGNWVYLILVNEVVSRTIRTLSLRLQIDSQLMLIRLYIARGIVSDCCGSLAQLILIYRCWIVWGKNICVVVIPSLLVITCLATSLTPLAEVDHVQFVQGLNWIVFLPSPNWPGQDPMYLTSSAVSMAVNTLVTGLIVFKIMKVFLEVKGLKTTSIERTLGSTEGTKLQHIIFIIIESGMAVFVIQLVSIMFYIPGVPLQSPPNTYDFINSINQMLNGITPTIIYVRVLKRLSFDDEESFKEAVGSLRFNNPPSDLDAQQRMGTLGSSGSIPPQERNEDICLNNPPSDPEFSNTLQRMGSSSMLPQEREDVSILEIPRSPVNPVHPSTQHNISKE